MNKEKYFSKEFIHEMLIKNNVTSEINVYDVEQFDIDNSASILVTLTSESSDEFIGHFGIRVTYSINGNTATKKMVMKVKPHGTAISEMLNGLSSMCSEDVHKEYEKVKNITGFYDTHDKEIFIYENASSNMFPLIYGSYINEQENVYVLLMEYFEDAILLNSVMDTEAWDVSKIQIGVDAMLAWHKINTGNTTWYTSNYNDYRTEEQIQKLQATWQALLNNATEKFPELYSNTFTQKLTKGIKEIRVLWTELEYVPKSVVHNDFNPRNAYFKIKENLDPAICVYDWELATIHFPMYDLVEFLSFTASSLSDDELLYFIRYFQAEMASNVELYEEDSIFNACLLCSIYDFGLHRIGMYMMAHSVSPYPFMPHVLKNYERLLNYATQH